MTEDDWLACTAPRRMLSDGFDGDRARRKRLLASVIAERLRPLLRSNECLAAVEAVARSVDGLISRDDLQHISWRMLDELEHETSLTADQGWSHAVIYAVDALAFATTPEPSLKTLRVALDSQRSAIAVASGRNDELVRAAEQKTQADWIRDIFGNPFRTVAFHPRWRTEDVLGLARGIYEERAFDRLPLLADALMDAGCDADDVLSHCRGEGPHVRGCWVVDLVLGKE